MNGHRIGESCGIFAVFGARDAARLAYLGLFALQHQGPESAGIVVSDGRKIRSRKGLGLLGEVVVFPSETSGKRSVDYCGATAVPDGLYPDGRRGHGRNCEASLYCPVRGRTRVPK